MRFLREHTDRTIKVTVPGPFTMSQQAQDDHYGDPEQLALAYADAVNAEVHDLFAAGADIVQLDEPYLQARPEPAREYGLEALNRALDGVIGTTAVHLCFGYAAIIHERPSATRSCPSWPTAPATRSRSRPHSPTWTRRCSRTGRQDDHARRASTCPTRRSSPSSVVAARVRRALPYVDAREGRASPPTAA